MFNGTQWKVQIVAPGIPVAETLGSVFLSKEEDESTDLPQILAYNKAAGKFFIEEDKGEIFFVEKAVPDDFIPEKKERLLSARHAIPLGAVVHVPELKEKWDATPRGTLIGVVGSAHLYVVNRDVDESGDRFYTLSAAPYELPKHPDDLAVYDRICPFE